MNSERTSPRPAFPSWLACASVTAALLLGLLVPSPGAFADSRGNRLVDTNAHQFVANILADPMGVVSSPPVRVSHVWNDFSYYLQHFVIGWEIEISDQAVVPVDVTLPPEYGMIADDRADQQCQLASGGVGGGPPSVGMQASSDKKSYRLYPDLFVTIADTVHLTLPNKIFIILEGSAAGSSMRGPGAPALDCLFYVPIVVTNHVQEFIVNLTANVHSIAPPPAELAFGTFTGSGQDVTKTPFLSDNQSLPVPLVGLEPSMNVTGKVEAAYTGDTGMDWHDDDYMTVQWQGGDEQLTGRGGPGAQTHHSPVYRLDSPDVKQFCVGAKAYDEDTLNGDDVSDSEMICAWLSYTQVQPELTLPGTPLGDCLLALEGKPSTIDVVSVLKGEPCFDIECIDFGRIFDLVGDGFHVFGVRIGGTCTVFVDDRNHD